MRGGWCCIRGGCTSMSNPGDDRSVLMDLGHDRPQVPARARNMAPIVPRASISGRALVAVVAIMTFLASVTTGVVLLVSASAAEWQSEVSSEITVQVRPVAGRDIERDVATVANAMRAQPGIVDVRPYTKEESGKLLEPWLGTGLSLDDLPVPRMIVAQIAPGTKLDLDGLRSRVTQVVPSVSVDDHRAWIDRMRSMTGATVFAGIGILILVILATIISVSIATRGAMAADRPIVEVVHFVGAGDRYIALNRWANVRDTVRVSGRPLRWITGWSRQSRSTRMMALRLTIVPRCTCQNASGSSSSYSSLIGLRIMPIRTPPVLLGWPKAWRPRESLKT